MYATIHLVLLTRSVWEDRESSLPFLGIAVGAWEHGSLPPRENKNIKEKISSQLIYGLAVSNMDNGSAGNTLFFNMALL